MNTHTNTTHQEEAKSEPETAARNYFRPIITWVIGIAAVAALICFALYIADGKGGKPIVLFGGNGAVLEYEIPQGNTFWTEPSRKEIEKAYQERIAPLVEQMHQANTEAMFRALQGFRTDFKNLYAGIPPFIDDLTGYKTRFGVIGRLAKDSAVNWWKDNNSSKALEAYIAKKFEEHVLTEASVQELVQKTLMAYLDEVEANRNLLLSQIEENLSTGDIPLKSAIQMRIGDDFTAAFMHCFLESSKKMGVDSIMYGITSYLIGEVVASKMASVAIKSAAKFCTAAVAPIAAYITTSAVSSLSVQAVTQGVVMCSTAPQIATGGGAAGSFVGPVGTATGIVAGLAIGIVIDLWMTARFEKRTHEQLTGLLDDLMHSLEHGHAAGNGNAAPAKGMVKILLEANDRIHTLTQQAVFAAMTGGK